MALPVEEPGGCQSGLIGFEQTYGSGSGCSIARSAGGEGAVVAVVDGVSALEDVSAIRLYRADPGRRVNLQLVHSRDGSWAPERPLGRAEVVSWCGRNGRHAFPVDSAPAATAPGPAASRSQPSAGDGSAADESLASGPGWDVAGAAVPEPVRVALAALLSAVGPGGLSCGGSGLGDCDVNAAVERALAVIEASEAVQAWASFGGLVATRALHQGFREQLLSGPELADASKTARRHAEAEVRDSTAAEIEAATGLGAYEVGRRVRFALAPREATASACALLEAGATSYHRARTVVEATILAHPDMPAEVADQIGADALGPNARGNPRSYAQFRDRCRTLVRKQLGATKAAAVEHEQAVAARSARATLSDNGTGELSISGGEAAAVVAAMGRVDRIARRFRAAGDPRTLDQLRADVALDLLMYGWVAPHPDTTTTPRRTRRGADSKTDNGVRDPGSGRDREAGPDSSPGAEPDNNPDRSPETSRETEWDPGPAGETGAEEDAGPGMDPATDPEWGPGREPGTDPMGAYRRLGEPPPAQVDLIVALSTLLGLDDGVGQIPGHGPVTGALARQIALAHGSVWSRIVTDPLTGHAVERSTGSYRFDAEMSRQAKASDGVCRGPGCTVPAERCDQDHVQPYAADANGVSVGGPTSEANCGSAHRRHHNLKTRGHWTAQMHQDRTMTWTTAAGRTYVTHPMDYHELTATTPDQPIPASAGRDGDPLSYDSILAEPLDPDREWCDEDDLPIAARKPQRRPAPSAAAAPSPDDDTPPPF